MHDVRANVVVDLVEKTVVTIDGGQSSPQIVPLLTSVPGNLFIVPMVVKVCHGIQPHHINDIRDEVELKHPEEPEL